MAKPVKIKDNRKLRLDVPGLLIHLCHPNHSVQLWNSFLFLAYLGRNVSKRFEGKKIMIGNR